MLAAADMKRLSPEPYLLQSQLQSVTPRRTSKKIRRKNTAPKTPYTIAEVMEMETELRPPIVSQSCKNSKSNIF